MFENDYFNAWIYDNPDGTKSLHHLDVKKTRNGTLDLNEYEEFEDVSSIGTGAPVIGGLGNMVMVDSLILPRSVNKINAHAFHLANVQNIVWPDACFDIPEFAFSCSKLTQVHNIDHVRSIGHHAFSSSKIKSFAIPDGVTKIPGFCFMQTEISDIKGMEHIQSIGDMAFSYCANLESVGNLDRVFSIGNQAFFHCAIKSLDLSHGVCNYISRNAFECSQLREFKPSWFMQKI